ncbi:pilus assembly protein PilP [Thalassotalea sp. LPB0316]|uniref:pilus assembly protein PilP n=1 Tax=Thalassotalea sp. LPB0316 TaxID=2769490 RepID=UPI001865F727|nr:pilus assembly protein PilP [Thalassotalea sp. LPB0316]QOL26559.1 pilus assembly protein PilP [Thalassotalea sp. LPB0316]
MKKLMALAVALTLSGCFSDTSDLQAYTEQVKENTTNYVAPMPEILPFNHFEYSAQQLRSPFVEPQPEAIQEKMQQMAGCLSPDPRRRKQPLEKYALSSLTMRGTLGELGVTWALVEASDATLHRVTIDSYLGLYHGRIIDVTDDYVKVIELIPDGTGCWSERETTIAMSDGASQGQGK